MPKHIVYVPCAFIIDEETAAYIHLSSAAEDAQVNDNTGIPATVQTLIHEGKLPEAIRNHDSVLDKMGCFDRKAAAHMVDGVVMEGLQAASFTAGDYTLLVTLADGAETAAKGEVFCLTPEPDPKTGTSTVYGSAKEAVEMFKREILGSICEEGCSMFPDDFDWGKRVVSISGDIIDPHYC